MRPVNYQRHNYHELFQPYCFAAGDNEECQERERNNIRESTIAAFGNERRGTGAQRKSEKCPIDVLHLSLSHSFSLCVSAPLSLALESSSQGDYLILDP
jgi:hypothetical protein